MHVYTAGGAGLAFLATLAVLDGDFRRAFVWLFVAVLVDASDGWLARQARVDERLPQLSGARLDDLVDYLTYVFVPALLIWQAGLLPPSWAYVPLLALLVASACAFARLDAKTGDHYFTGFPSYWNVVAFYLFVGGLPPAANGAILLGLVALVLVRTRWVYPTRTPALRRLTLALGAGWGVLLALVLLRLPAQSPGLVLASLAFPAYYAGLSLALHVRRPVTRS